VVNKDKYKTNLNWQTMAGLNRWRSERPESGQCVVLGFIKATDKK